MTNPLNDEDYGSNDDQIDDLKDLVLGLAEALRIVRGPMIANDWWRRAEHTSERGAYDVVTKALKEVIEP